MPAAPERPTNGHNGRHGGHTNSIINLTPPIVSCETVGGVFSFGRRFKINVFEAVKPAVTARQAAEQYGIRVNEHGMAVCPFHNDKTPSMKLDNRFHCFACQADGDAIDFVSRLFGIPVRDAAVKIAEDFGIPYNQREGPATLVAAKAPAQEQERLTGKACCTTLTAYLRFLREWEVQFAPQAPGEKLHSLFVEALQRKGCIEYWLDLLLFGTPEEKRTFIVQHGKEVKKIEQSITELSTQGALYRGGGEGVSKPHTQREGR